MLRYLIPRKLAFKLLKLKLARKGEKVDHVFVIIGSDQGTRFTSGACVHIQPTALGGICSNPAHMAVACDIVSRALYWKHADLADEIAEAIALNKAAGRQ